MRRWKSDPYSMQLRKMNRERVGKRGGKAKKGKGYTLSEVGEGKLLQDREMSPCAGIFGEIWINSWKPNSERPLQETWCLPCTETALLSRILPPIENAVKLQLCNISGKVSWILLVICHFCMFCNHFAAFYLVASLNRLAPNVWFPFIYS